MAESISYFNGEFLPDSDCRIHFAHRGILRGDIIYDAPHGLLTARYSGYVITWSVSRGR